MKVSELIEELRSIDPDTEILVASDAEGNAFGHLNALSYGFVRTDDLDNWEPQLISAFDIVEDAEDEDSDGIFRGDCTEVLVIWP